MSGILVSESRGEVLVRATIDMELIWRTVEAASTSIQLECRNTMCFQCSVDVLEELERSLVRIEPDFLEFLFVHRNLSSGAS